MIQYVAFSADPHFSECFHFVDHFAAKLGVNYAQLEVSECDLRRGR